MTTWLIPALFGAIIGLGLLLLIRPHVPAQPRLTSALDRLSGADRPQVLSPAARADTSAGGRVGAWTQRHVSLHPRLLPSASDLDLAGKQVHTVLGEKVLFSLAILVAGPLLMVLTSLLGLGLPPLAPVGVTLAAAAGAFFLPDLQIRDQAKAAREEFSRAVAAYLELLAIERISGAGATQATEGAARVAQSWPFQRITEALERARWAGHSPWQALDDLGDETAVPELHAVANIMRMAGQEDSAVYDQLRSRAKSMRNSHLAKEHKRANEDSVRMSIPVTCTALVFMAMLVFPMLLLAFTAVPVHP
jgi:Flp pilus assembly protein TadB